MGSRGEGGVISVDSEKGGRRGQQWGMGRCSRFDRKLGEDKGGGYASRIEGRREAREGVNIVRMERRGNALRRRIGNRMLTNISQ